MRCRTHVITVGLVVAASAVLSAVALSPVSGSVLKAPTQAVEQGSTPAFLSGDSKTNCVYPSASISDLDMLSTLTGATFNCVLVFNDAKPTWADWTNAWWVSPPSPDSNWLSWLGAQPGRRLIISQSMVPDDAPSNWRVLGAQGAYDGYATQLATNLVAEGMGTSIIRLGWEANDTSDPYNALGSDPTRVRGLGNLLGQHSSLHEGRPWRQLPVRLDGQPVLATNPICGLVPGRRRRRHYRDGCV